MKKRYSKTTTPKKQSNTSSSIVENNKILSEVTKKDIEKSYKLETLNTEVHYSNRYGWTLRKSAE